MLYQVENLECINKIKKLFIDIRFNIGKSVFDGYIGNIYVDNLDNPNFAVLTARNYCLISGTISDLRLKNIIDKRLNCFKIIPSDKIANQIEKIYTNTDMIKSIRYSFKKNPKFNKKNLKMLSNSVPNEYKIVKITSSLAEQIQKKEDINITNTSENDIGYCCFYNDQIVGICGQWYQYHDGIEVNIRVNKEHQRKKIATSLAANMILECLEKKISISWDAANKISVKLAQKLGFEFDSSYNIYYFINN